MSAHPERLMRLYNRLKRGPLTIEIAKKWAKQAGIEIGERQLYRDLNSLKFLNVNDSEKIIESDSNEKNRKTWKIEFSDSKDKVSTYDINSFYLLKNFAPFSILEERKDSIEKFERIIFKELSKSKFQQYIQANELYLRKTKYNENMYGEAEHGQIESLVWALQNSKAILIEKDLINTANLKMVPEDFPLIFYPMELVFHRGRVSVAGINTKGRFLIFTIDRDFHFSVTGEMFNRKKYEKQYKSYFEKLYGLSEPINEKVYHIKIEFTESYGESFKSFFWHQTQRWEQLKNGHYMLHLDCTIGRELIGFLAIGLSKVKVHSPAILKKLIVKKLEESLDIYKNDRGLDEEESNRGL